MFSKKKPRQKKYTTEGQGSFDPKKQTDPLSYTTTNLCTTPQHNLSITTHHPRTCLHIPPYARAQDYVCRQQDPPQSTENEKLEVTFSTKTNDFEQNSRYSRKEQTQRFFNCVLFLSGQFVIYYVRLLIQSEDLVHLKIFSALFCETVLT